LLNCPAHRVLGYAAKALHVDLREKVNGSNNGNIEATLSALKHKGWNSSTTLATALYELRALGFLAVTRGGGVENGSRVCTLYRFTDLPVFEHPKLGIKASLATDDYLLFDNVGKAEAALKTGVHDLRQAAIERKRKASERKKTTLQNLERTDPKSGAVNGFNAPKSGAEHFPPLQNLEQTSGPEKGREPAPGNTFGRIATEQGSKSACSKNCTPLYSASGSAQAEGDPARVNLDPDDPALPMEKTAAHRTLPTLRRLCSECGEAFETVTPRKQTCSPACKKRRQRNRLRLASSAGASA